MGFFNIRIKLESLDKNYSIVLSDIETLENITKEIQKKVKGRALISDDLYLRLTSIQILAISILEFLLKREYKINYQKDIINCIKESPELSVLQKDWLILLILIRHTIVHEYGHYDKQFWDNVGKHIQKLKVEKPENDSYRSPLNPDQVIMCLNLLKKYIYLDVLSKHLTKKEKASLSKELTVSS